MSYVSLHNQTSFSILDSIISPDDLFKRASELGQKAIAVTEHGSFASVWDALKASRATGVKLIVGCEYYFVNSSQNHEGEKIRHIILLAKNAKGYQNLLLINRLGFEKPILFANKIYPLIDWSLLEAHNEGVICLTACGSGIVSQLINTKKLEEAETTLLRLKSIFKDDLGVEILPNNMRKSESAYNSAIDQPLTNNELIKLAKKHNVRIVPASNTHYLKKEDHEEHDVMLAIGAGQPIYSNARKKYGTPEFYLHSEEDIFKFFSRLNDPDEVQSWIDNSEYFADLCENPEWVDPKYSNPTGKELPSFPVQDEPDYQEFLSWLSTDDFSKKLDEDQAYLRFKCFSAAQKLFPVDKVDLYTDRLEKELDVLNYCGVASYMLVVADYVKFAKNNGISVGPGRGSVAGSLVAYLLNIHEADPIKYGLVFERFHNKLKKSYSDIDIDFSKINRGKVIDYLVSKYGQDNVAAISNLNTITPKVYARDISRSCEFGGSREKAVKLGTNIADLIPKEYHSIDKALNESPLLSDFAKRYPQLAKFKGICGQYRAWSTHAAGIVVSKRPLSGLVPLRKDKEGSLVLEYEKERAEENGLVKIDLLGLRTLDEIDHTIELIRKSGLPEPKFDYDAYDKKTYDLISSGNTLAVFQFGTSQGTIDLCKKIQPKSIEDLAIISALARPAVKEIREDLIAVRNGQKKPDFIHQSLENAFTQSYGFPLYDESLLILAKDVAGWDLGEADKLRKLTKEKGKNPQKAKKWHEEFIDGAVKNGIDKNIAQKIWVDIVEPFGKYGFNKSHAITYSMISYKTAYLKAHYPVHALLAKLTSEIAANAINSKALIEKIKAEFKKYNVKITPPNINKSQYSYTLHDSKTLITGFEAIKFVNEEAIAEIVSKRPFKNFFDMVTRCDAKKVNSKTIQALAAAGCLDELGLTRKQILLYCQDYRNKLKSWLKKHDPSKEEMSYPWPQEKDWTTSEKYALEVFYLGEAFICNKKDAYTPFFNGNDVPLSYIRGVTDKRNLPSVKAEIKDIFEFKVKKENSKSFGKDMAKITIEDQFGDQCGVTIFPEKWELVKSKFRQISNGKYKLEAGVCIHFSATTNFYEEEVGLLLDNVYNFSPLPPLPADLKAKKISLRETKPKTAQSASKDEILEDLEDELLDEGLLEYNPDED